MKNCVFRPARQGDLVDIINIWTAAFGDDPAFPRRLLSDCGLLKNALVAECEGRAVSSLLLYRGLKPGGYEADYLYALCTHPDHSGRGIGTALTAYAAERSRNRGSKLLLLQPGDEELERWYASIGFRVLWRSRWERLDISGVSPSAAQPVSADEFLRCLSPDTVFTPELIASQESIHSVYGGAFLRTEQGLICAEYDGCILRIRHALCPERELAPAAAAAAKHFGAEQVFRLRRDDENGSTALMALPLQVPVPPLPEDIFFSFTLD